VPKYANGDVAALGDIVCGIPEGVGHEVNGEIYQLTDKDEGHNCIVVFTDKNEVPIHTHDPNGILPVEVIDGDKKKKFHVHTRQAPGETSKFVKLSPPTAKPAKKQPAPASNPTS
jgi:hypothetical protein